MKIGDYIDPVDLGHSAVDWKSLAREVGYTTTAIKTMERVPEEIRSDVDKAKERQSRYEYVDKAISFVCRFCGDRNGSMWRHDVIDDVDFVACGSCHKVVEVK